MHPNHIISRHPLPPHHQLTLSANATPPPGSPALPISDLELLDLVSRRTRHLAMQDMALPVDCHDKAEADVRHSLMICITER